MKNLEMCHFKVVTHKCYKTQQTRQDIKNLHTLYFFKQAWLNKKINGYLEFIGTKKISLELSIEFNGVGNILHGLCNEEVEATVELP